jgi:hypothetical protein
MPQMRADWNRNHIEECRASFRQHYIESNGLDEDDITARISLDIRQWTMKLVRV